MIAFIQRKGIVAMRLQGNRLRHTTLWNGSKFVDVENGMARNYYLTNIGTAKLELWELK